MPLVKVTKILDDAIYLLLYMTVCNCIYMFRGFVVFQSGLNIFFEEGE